MQILAMLALLQDETLVREYHQRLAKIEDTAAGHYKLALWCLQNDLTDLAEERFEKTVGLDPEHGDARDRLGFAKENGVWVETAARKLRKRCVRAVRDGLKFPATEALAKKGRFYKKAIEQLCWPEAWVRALIAIHEQTGLFEETLDVQVKFGKLDALGSGEGENGKGSVTFDLDRVVDYLKKAADVEREKAETEIQLLVPIFKLSSLVAHELTRVFLNRRGPAWFQEGLAGYATRSPYWLCFMKVYRFEITPIDQAPTEKRQHVGRGQAFFAWLDETAGRDKFKEFVKRCVHGGKIEEAATQATGLSWEALLEKEQAWSKAFIKSQKMNW